MTVLHYLEKTAHDLPHKTAIIDDHGRLSFSQLRSKALSVARCISQKLGGQRHQPILVCLPKGKECIAAFMGIVYSGNIYTPTDVRFPFSKVQSIIDVLGPSLYIADAKSAQKLRENGIPEASILLYEDSSGSLPQLDADAALRTAIDTDPVYTLFTSGSTGIPKGVIVTHRSIVDYIDWATQTFDLSSAAIIGNQAPFYFDNSTLDIYLCLKHGAELRIIPEHFFSFPAKLMQAIVEYGVNFVFWVPSVLISVANQDILTSVDCSCLTKILFAGEVMPNKHLNYWRQKIPRALYANLYGPTEITVDCTCYIVDRTFSDDEPLPIGFPCANTGVFLLDEENALITFPDNQGELCVRGSSLAEGYWNAPETTAERFCQNPLNPHYPERIYRTGDLAHYNKKGEIMFDGRKDFQIKHFGYRIELGEIETAASGLDNIHTASADYDAEKQEIVLFFSGDFENKSLQKNLLDILPKYMVPTRYVQLSEFPYNDNGKIDRRKLREDHMEV